MRTPSADATVRPKKPGRKLKPEAARWARQRRSAELERLYETPVTELSPEDIARMKAAFFGS